MGADERWMAEALAVAAEGLALGELPIGAVVVLDDEVVSRASTQERAQRRLLVHAELLALDAADRALGRRRRDAVLYSTLEPCLGCLGAAMTTMVGTVVYGLGSAGDGAADLARAWDDGRAKEDLPAHHLPTIRGGVLAEGSRALFERYVAEAPEGPMTAWARTLVAR